MESTPAKQPISDNTHLKQQLAVPAILALLAVILYFIPALESVLVWQRQAIFDGEIWRLLTGHLLHTNFAHLAMNLAGLGLIAALHRSHYKPLPTSILITTLALLTGIGLLFAAPDMTSYVGLSGLLHGLFAWGALMDIRKGWRSGYLLLAGVIIKVGMEQLGGADPDLANMIEAKVATEAHLVGLVGGFVMFIVAMYKKQANKVID